MKKIYQFMFVAALSTLAACNCCVKDAKCSATQDEVARPETMSEVLTALKDGNSRFVTGKAMNYHRDIDYVAALKDAQHPFAVVVACSDSRVPVELLFDQGVGDLFVIRTAGNTVLDNVTEASVEYAVNHLGVNTVIMLGHTSCGAITGVVEYGDSHGHEVEGDEEVVTLIEHIAEAIPQHKGTHKDLDAAIQANLDVQMNVILNSENIKHKIEDGKVQIIAAMYDIANGVVTFQE